MKKTCLALLCTLGLTFGLFALPTNASGNLCFLGLNDTLPAPSVQTTPIQYNGWIYIPMGVFKTQITGVNFGVFCGLTDNDTNLVFYNLSGKNMTFDLVNGTATAVGASSPMPSNVLHRNGTYYAPASPICQYFGLTYSLYNTDYGFLLRIKDGNAMLSDALFLSSTASMMKNYAGEEETTTPSGEKESVQNPTPTPAKNPPVENTAPTEPEPEPEPDPVFSLSLGITLAAWNNITPTLDALSSPKVDAVIFFPTEDIWNCSNHLRQTAGRGFRIGLIPEGETSEQKLDSLTKGRAAVSQILHREVWFVYSEEDTLLSDAGYLCWSPDVTLSTGRSGETLYASILQSMETKPSAGNVLLDGFELSGQILAQFVTCLKNAGDTFLPLRETSYSS